MNSYLVAYPVWLEGIPERKIPSGSKKSLKEKFSATGLAQELQVELSLASRCHPPACIVVCVGHESSSPFPFSFSFRRPWFSRMDLVPLRFSGSRCLLQQIVLEGVTFQAETVIMGNLFMNPSRNRCASATVLPQSVSRVSSAEFRAALTR